MLQNPKAASRQGSHNFDKPQPKCTSSKRARVQSTSKPTTIMHVEICSSSRIELCDLLGLAKGKMYEDLLECIPSKSLGNYPCFSRSSNTAEFPRTAGGSKVLPNTSLNINNIRIGQDLSSSKLPFLWKLHEMLDDVEKTGDDHIVSWLPHGKGFRVHKPKSFVQKIIPHYFNQSKYKSFQRQLHLYDFVRTPRGAEAGAYAHPLFVRGKKSLCRSLTPHKIKGKIPKKDQVVSAPIITPSGSCASSLQEQQSRKRARSDSLSSGDTSGCEDERAPKRNSTFTINSIQCVSNQAVNQQQEKSMDWTQAIQNILVTGASLAAQLEANKKTEGSSQKEEKLGVSPHDGDVVYAFGGKAFRFIEDAPGELPALVLDEAMDVTCCGDDVPAYDGEDAELLAQATNSTIEELINMGYSTLAI